MATRNKNYDRLMQAVDRDGKAFFACTPQGAEVVRKRIRSALTYRYPGRIFSTEKTEHMGTYGILVKEVKK